MSSAVPLSRVLAALPLRSLLGSKGRLATLFAVLAMSLFVHAIVSLQGVGLAGRAAASVDGGGPLPRGVVAVLIRTGPAMPLSEAQGILTPPALAYLPNTIAAFYGSRDKGFVPGRWVEVIRLHQLSEDDPPWKPWFDVIEGKLPSKPGEIAAPRPVAQAMGWYPGSEVSFTPASGVRENLRVVGVYEPLGLGPICESLLGVQESPAHLAPVNFAVIRDSRHLSLLEASWRTFTPEDLSKGAVQRHFLFLATCPREDMPRTLGGEPRQGWSFITGPPAVSRARGLAKAIYRSQAASFNLGFGLVGAAVLIILVIALHERRRELAAYKLVGLGNAGAAVTLVVELGVAAGAAVLAAGPSFIIVARHYLLPGQAAGPGLLALTLATSVLWMLLLAVIGAGYPLALATVATPRELMARQRVYLFRRKVALRSLGSSAEE